MKPALPQFLPRAALFLALYGSASAQAPASSGSVQPPSRPSNELKSTLSASLPRYTPPPPPDEAPKPTVVAEPEEDKPKNAIVRLPRYIVEGDRPPVFRERDIYTKKGLAQLAAKRYLSDFDRNGLNKYTLPLFGIGADQRALAQYEEAERLREMGEANDKVYLLRQTDAAAAGQLKDTVDSTFMRRSDYGPTSTSVGGKP